MPKQRETRQAFFERMAEYEREYPVIVESLNRYSVAMQTYQTACNRYSEPRISISNSTVYLDHARVK